MGERGSKIRGKLVETLDLPADIALGVPKITMIGKSELTIENHKGIVKFESDELIINTSLGFLNILGEDFEIIFVGGTTIALRGTFKSVVYECYEENE